MAARTRWTCRVRGGKPAGMVWVMGMLNKVAQRRRSRPTHLSLSAGLSVSTLLSGRGAVRWGTEAKEQFDTLTFDLERWSVVARFQEATEKDGDVCYLAGAEDGGMLVEVFIIDMK